MVKPFAKASAAWIVLTCLIALALPAPVRAQLAPKLKVPYALEVVVRFDNDRTFTTAFKEQVQTELRALLQQAFGKLAKVKVQAHHPLLKEIEQKGLQKTLDGWDNLSGVRTHFLLIHFQDGSFHLQSRQHDGATNLASPEVRQASTPDREQVARLAALLVEQDFGVVGTVTDVAGHTVKIAVQGGGLGEPLEPWVRPKQVFAICRIVKSGGKERSELLAHTLLQVQSALGNGKFLCHLHTSRYEPEKLHHGPQVLGYRCLHLPTRPTKLSFQLLAAKSDQPLSGLQIHVSPTAFGKEENPGDVLKLAVDAKGRAHTGKVFTDVAFVRVLSGSTILSEFPVALVDGKTGSGVVQAKNPDPVFLITCRVSVNTELAKEAQLEFRLHQWLKRILEDLYIASDRTSLLKTELGKSPADAIKLAKSGLASLDTELKALNQERFDLEAEAEKVKAAIDLNEGQQGLHELVERKKQLEKFITDVEQFVKYDAETKQLKTMLTQAGLLEEQADYDQAIDTYKKVLAIRKDEKDVQSHLHKLQADWTKDRGAEHKKAREFVYEVWPEKMDTAELKLNLPKAQAAFALFKKTGDHLTPRKMLQANLAHGVSLKNRLDALKNAPLTEDNRTERTTIGRLATELRDLHIAVRDWVDGNELKK